ncbi:hypothetical protein [Methylocystis bryophila]|uniref:hypothetical protein n=1 Tax=Methylocystis bryophila TaxID=655015 RepID=UPI00131A04EC|nr:hypothetical protein [Methylocystis bryophila]BDV39439.1 hypothetical protein DSM21852_26920 [Methylocystis bryophila]
MRNLGLIFLVWSSTAAAGQTLSEDLRSQFYNKCLRDAFAYNQIDKHGGGSSYSCYGETAKAWFDSLSGDKTVHDKNGTFVARYYGETGYCAHQTEDTSGKPASAYVCEIVTDTP